ncbi:MAG TPA: RES family NAD+ phosphorylase [Xanthobacteraceae bacterium]|nr:RES family NAD+ phosphorylase [Xanthobacteraceae bacterium]
MRLWRISNHADLSGEGGRRVAGRWHERGRPAVYLAEHAALALLETLVHLEIDPEDLPSHYRLLTVDVPDGVAVEDLTEAELAARVVNWRQTPQETRRLTRAWFGERRTALLRVPSVIVPEAYNYLLNPLHPDAAGVALVASQTVEFDARLFGAPTPAGGR